MCVHVVILCNGCGILADPHHACCHFSAAASYELSLVAVIEFSYYFPMAIGMTVCGWVVFFVPFFARNTMGPFDSFITRNALPPRIRSLQFFPKCEVDVRQAIVQ